MRERGFHPIWPSLPWRKSQKLVRNPMANPSCWVTQTFKHPTILYRCTPQLRHPPNTNPSEMLTGIFFFSGKLIRRYLYIKPWKLVWWPPPTIRKTMGIDPPNPAIEVDLSASATPSAAPAVELNSPCFSATPKEDPGICKKPWLKPSQPKGVMSCLESSKLFPFKLGVVEGFFFQTKWLRCKKSTTWGVNDFFLDSPSSFLNGWM